MLSEFMPVPVDALSAEFASGADAVEICARTVRALVDEGARAIYISNLPLRRTHATLAAILERAGLQPVGRSFSSGAPSTRSGAFRAIRARRS